MNKLTDPIKQEVNRLQLAICEIGKRMYENKYVASTDGNISVRLSDDLFLCTPSNTCKGDLIPEQIILTNQNCEVLEGKGVVSSEFYTHLSAYQERKDIGAVIHAHPTFCIVISLANISLTSPILPELVMSLGEVPTTEYATPGSKEGAQIIKPWIKNHNVILLKAHGILTVGVDLYQAYSYLERVEHSAQIIYLTHLLTTPPILSEEQRIKLTVKRQI